MEAFGKTPISGESKKFNPHILGRQDISKKKYANVILA
jgi:hypothetical protein